MPVSVRTLCRPGRMSCLLASTPFPAREGRGGERRGEDRRGEEGRGGEGKAEEGRGGKGKAGEGRKVKEEERKAGLLDEHFWESRARNVG